LTFTEAAAELLTTQALERRSGRSATFAGVRFKDYQFGLKLISQNTGREEFVIDVHSVEAPDKVLSEWVVASYREKEGGIACPSSQS